MDRNFKPTAVECATRWECPRCGNVFDTKSGTDIPKVENPLCAECGCKAEYQGTVMRNVKPRQ